MKRIIGLLAAVAALSAAPAPQTFTGTIADSECGEMGHTHMQMGPTDAECTLACIDAHGAAYVLVSGSRSYALSDQSAPKAFAGQTVVVVGTLDDRGRTIQVESIAAAPAAKP